MENGDPILWYLLLQLVLIVINAVFACAEIAVISINDAKLARLASTGDKRAVRLVKLTKQPARFFYHTGGNNSGRFSGQRFCGRQLF